MTAEQLLEYGASELVYLRWGILHGERTYVILRADGKTLEAVDAVETAIEVVAEKGFRFVTVIERKRLTV